MGIRTDTFERQSVADNAGGGGAEARQTYAIADATIVQNTIGASISGGVITMPGGTASVDPTDANALILEWPLLRSDGTAANALDANAPIFGDLVLGMDPSTLIADGTDLEVVLELRANNPDSDRGRGGVGASWVYGVGDPTGRLWYRIRDIDPWSNLAIASPGLVRNSDATRLRMSWGSSANPRTTSTALRNYFLATGWILADASPPVNPGGTVFAERLTNLATQIGTQGAYTVRLSVLRTTGAAGAIDLQPIISGTYWEHIAIV